MPTHQKSVQSLCAVNSGVGGKKEKANANGNQSGFGGEQQLGLRDQGRQVESAQIVGEDTFYKRKTVSNGFAPEEDPGKGNQGECDQELQAFMNTRQSIQSDKADGFLTDGQGDVAENAVYSVQETPERLSDC